MTETEVEAVDYSDFEDDDPADLKDEVDAVDLYEDLCATSFNGTAEGRFQTKENAPESSEREGAVPELTAKIEVLEGRIKILEDDRVQLIRNISCLFKTAQSEIYRKDAEIRRLREAIASKGSL